MLSMLLRFTRLAQGYQQRVVCKSYRIREQTTRFSFRLSSLIVNGLINSFFFLSFCNFIKDFYTAATEKQYCRVGVYSLSVVFGMLAASPLATLTYEAYLWLNKLTSIIAAALMGGANGVSRTLSIIKTSEKTYNRFTNRGRAQLNFADQLQRTGLEKFLMRLYFQR